MGRPMPANDERDPLENWLDQQVRPLPPPPGTFELISKRARHRKFRKLAITVTSAAAVAAGVVLGVTNVTPLNLTGPPATGHIAAGQSSAGQSSAGSTGPVTGGPNGTATRARPPAAPSATAGVAVPNAGPVPPDFSPTSVTFVSASRAWVIGQAGTPGQCYNGSICTSVAWTGDGGKTWHGEHAPVAGAPSGATGVSGIRFLDGVNGWAFGPELWVTHDAGNNWHPVSTGGRRVTGLEAVGDRAYALFASCSGASGAGFAAGCGSYTLMTSAAGGGTWTPVGAATSGLTAGSSAGGSGASAMLALTGSAGYLVAPDGTLYTGPIGGSWHRAGTLPCAPGGSPQASGLPSGALLALQDSTHLALACRTAVYTSGDGGTNWVARAVPPAGTPTSLAATVSGTLVLATTQGINVLPADGSHWTPASAGPSGTGGAPSPGLPQGGFSYVGMTTATHGVAMPADSSLHEIWLTTDGGATWTPSPVS
jgi:hypothetical protein